MENSKDRDGRLFSEQQSEEMWSPQMILPVHDPPPPVAGLKRNFADEGLGWWLKDYHGRKLVGHPGGVELAMDNQRRRLEILGKQVWPDNWR